MSLTCSTISLNIKATVTLLPSLQLGDYEVNQWRQPIVQPSLRYQALAFISDNK